MRPYKDIESFLCNSIGFFAAGPPIDFGKIDAQGFNFSKQGTLVHPQVVGSCQSIILIAFVGNALKINFRNMRGLWYALLFYIAHYCATKDNLLFGWVKRGVLQRSHNVSVGRFFLSDFEESNEEIRSCKAACAAARRAIGTRKGEQET
jgi:hypothetical protein